MGTTTTPSSTVERQGPTALLALVQHINDHGLGAPHTIHTPTDASPYFTVAIWSYSVDAWTASGFEIDEVEAHAAGGGRIGGKLYEAVTLLGKLMLPFGSIPVRVTYSRPLPEQAPVAPRLVAVTDGCFQ